MRLDENKFPYKAGTKVVYLIKTEYNSETLLKVGYTSDLKKRMNTYNLYNPKSELLKVREGSTFLESSLHRRFKHLLYPDCTEWFYYDDQIITEFDTYLSDGKYDTDFDKIKSYVNMLLKPVNNKNDYIHNSWWKIEKIFGKNMAISTRTIQYDELSSFILQDYDELQKVLDEYISSFDYSEVPKQLDINKHYSFSIPIPYLNVYLIITSEKLFREEYRMPRYDGERELIKIKAPNNTYFWEGYNSRFMIKVGNTNNYLRQYKNFNTSAEKEFLVKNVLGINLKSNFTDSYLSVNPKGIPFFNKDLYKIEKGILLVHISYYKSVLNKGYEVRQLS